MNPEPKKHHPKRWKVWIKTVLLAVFYVFLYFLWASFQAAGRTIPSQIVWLFGAFAFFFTGSYLLSVQSFMQHRPAMYTRLGIMLEKIALLMALFTGGGTAGAHTMSWYSRLSVSEQTKSWLWGLAILTVLFMGISKWVQLVQFSRQAQTKTD